MCPLTSPTAQIKGRMEFRTPRECRHEHTAIDWLGVGNAIGGEKHRGMAMDRHLRGDHEGSKDDKNVCLHPGYHPFK